MENIEKAHETHDLNLSSCARGVWLVKVPKYLSEQWKSCEGSENVGKLIIGKPKVPGGKADVSFTSMLPQQTGKPTPTEHKFSLTTVTGHTIGVLSETPNPDHETKGGPMAHVAIDGRVVHRAECRPLIKDKNYMSLKRLQMETVNKPRREVKQLERIVQTYKPVAAHAFDREQQLKKKNTVKRSRQEKGAVMDVLFGAFEKHQYYNIKDLERITKQPMPYLKEILNEICTYNMKAPHRNTWELKSEYRHYKGGAEKK